VDTLDGQTRTLDEDMVLIADDDGPTSIAGVMGGARSEVAGDTTRVLLEAATWDGPNINRTSSRLGLRSEASGRFEKGLQPEPAGCAGGAPRAGVRGARGWGVPRAGRGWSAAPARGRPAPPDDPAREPEGRGRAGAAPAPRRLSSRRRPPQHHAR